jgi:hypothetical protein
VAVPAQASFDTSCLTPTQTSPAQSQKVSCTSGTPDQISYHVVRIPRCVSLSPLSLLPMLLHPRLPIVMTKFSLRVSHPVLLWFCVMEMLRSLSRVLVFLAFPPPPPVIIEGSLQMSLWKLQQHRNCKSKLPRNRYRLYLGYDLYRRKIATSAFTLRRPIATISYSKKIKVVS